MTSNDHGITTFDTLLSADPGLKAALRQASSLEQFTQTVAASAQRHGMALDAGELQAQLQARLDRASASGELTDQQLEAVAGGSNVFDLLYQGLLELAILPYRLQQERRR